MRQQGRIICSVAWGMVIWLLSMYFSVDRIESYYAMRVAEGGDRAFGDLGFLWLMTTTSMGLVGFGLGFWGVLPGTKR